MTCSLNYFSIFTLLILLHASSTKNIKIIIQPKISQYLKRSSKPKILEQILENNTKIEFGEHTKLIYQSTLSRYLNYILLQTYDSIKINKYRDPKIKIKIVNVVILNNYKT